MTSLLILFLLIVSNANAEDPESTNYISPGCRISWNFKSTVLLDVKVSFGRMQSEEYYYNLTIGKKFVLGNNAKSDGSQHFYLDIQSGSFFDYYPLSAGGGLGVAIFTKPEVIKLYPRLTIFGGAGLFCTLDYVFIKNLTDFGLQAVLPIPFNEDYRELDPN